MIGVLAARQGSEWRVRLRLPDDPSPLPKVFFLTPDDADALAYELRAYAKVCRGEHEAQLPEGEPLHPTAALHEAQLDPPTAALHEAEGEPC